MEVLDEISHHEGVRPVTSAEMCWLYSALYISCTIEVHKHLCPCWFFEDGRGWDSSPLTLDFLSATPWMFTHFGLQIRRGRKWMWGGEWVSGYRGRISGNWKPTVLRETACSSDWLQVRTGKLSHIRVCPIGWSLRRYFYRTNWCGTRVFQMWMNLTYVELATGKCSFWYIDIEVWQLLARNNIFWRLEPTSLTDPPQLPWM